MFDFDGRFFGRWILAGRLGEAPILFTLLHLGPIHFVIYARVEALRFGDRSLLVDSIPFHTLVMLHVTIRGPHHHVLLISLLHLDEVAVFRLL